MTRHVKMNACFAECGNFQDISGMKQIKVLCTLLLLLTFSTGAKAQVGGGAMAGLVFSQIDGDAFGGYGKFGYHLGGFSTFAFSDMLELEVEILLGQRGAREATDVFIYHRRLNYIDVPVLLNVRLFGSPGNGGMLQAGPYLGILYSANEGIKNLKSDVTYQYKTVELGGLAAANMEFADNWAVSFRWGLSLNNILATRNPWTRNRYLEIALRYHWR